MAISSATRVGRAAPRSTWYTPGVELQVLAHGQVLVQREALRHVADARLDRLALRGDVEAEHAALAAGRA